MNFKSWYNSKTVWFNVFAGIAFILALPTFMQVIPTSWAPYIGIITAFVNWVLRTFFTGQPIGPQTPQA